MTKWLPIGFDEAFKRTIETLETLGSELIGLSEGAWRIAAEDIPARVDSPSINASMKDGYAVVSDDLLHADISPVKLKLTGTSAAGDMRSTSINRGEAFRILTGAKIPSGSNAVLAEEFAETDNDGYVKMKNTAEPGRNILPKGSDVRTGEYVIKRGEIITPGHAGLLAAAGLSEVPVFRKPVVAIIATGDEVVAPGAPLPEGKLYASNMVTLSAFCHSYGMKSYTLTAKDQHQEIRDTLERAIESSDSIITSGGAWTGDRDLIAKILDEMGWKRIFHRIRIGPGKAVGFGILKGKAVFILPGGPPSNLMGFLQIALPGLMKLSGHPAPGLKKVTAELSGDIHGRDIDWTQFIFGYLDYTQPGLPRYHSLKSEGRLQSMARAGAIAAIPEGTTRIAGGSIVQVQVISSPY